MTSGQSSDLPRTNTPGEVVNAPVYIRVRPSWLERLLLVCVLIQILLVTNLLVYGSEPAREARDTSLSNNKLLCRIIFNQAPERYSAYIDSKDCPPMLPDTGPQP